MHYCTLTHNINPDIVLASACLVSRHWHAAAQRRLYHTVRVMENNSKWSGYWNDSRRRIAQAWRGADHWQKDVRALKLLLPSTNALLNTFREHRHLFQLVKALEFDFSQWNVVWGVEAVKIVMSRILTRSGRIPAIALTDMPSNSAADKILDELTELAPGILQSLLLDHFAQKESLPLLQLLEQQGSLKNLSLRTTAALPYDIGRDRPSVELAYLSINLVDILSPATRGLQYLLPNSQHSLRSLDIQTSGEDALEFNFSHFFHLHHHLVPLSFGRAERGGIKHPS